MTKIHQLLEGVKKALAEGDLKGPEIAMVIPYDKDEIEALAKFAMAQSLGPELGYKPRLDIARAKNQVVAWVKAGDEHKLTALGWALSSEK